MSGRNRPDFSELAYHIVRLCAFWRQSRCRLQNDSLVHVIGAMIGVTFGLDHADRIARAVILEVDTLGIAGTDDEVDPEGSEVAFIAAFLQEQVGEVAVPANADGSASGFDQAPNRCVRDVTSFFCA